GALHGKAWRAALPEPRGRFPRHAAVTAAGAIGLAAFFLDAAAAAAAAGLVWVLGSAELALARIAPGPRTAGEVARMVATSLVLPPLAVWHRGRGWLRVARLRRAGRLAWRPAPDAGRLRLLL